jgi:DMSO/TMAO reductase YedYZ heme-binding membrane subunit
MTVLLASAPSLWWYATRGAGAAALVLLTASVVLGVVDVGRWQSPRWPRFVVDGLHRTVSLLAVAMVAVHVVATVADSFTSIGLSDAVIPFASSYRPLWLGLGALSFDVLLAVAVTSMMRRRIGHRAWRAVHWAAYACWPLALLHGLGAGTDTPVAWMLLLTLACLAPVLAAAGWRAAAAWRDDPRKRALAGALAGASLLALVLWTASGPLGPRWASRAGTPATLLASVGAAPSGSAAPATSNTANASAPSLRFPFTSHLGGAVHQRSLAGGDILVDIRSRLSGPPARLEVQIQGQPLGDGGVAMRASRVALGPPASPLRYRGQVTALGGSRLTARVGDGTTTVELHLDLAIDQVTGRVRGTATARSLGGSS